VPAVDAALKWTASALPEIVQIIFLLKYAEEEVKAALMLVGIEANTEGGSDEVHLILKETKPGSATCEIRETLRDNVRSGGDTWECGDFGDVDDPQTGAKLRVSFSEIPPDWVPPLAHKKKDDCPKMENTYRKYQQFNFRLW
jgi:hypothetical protein